MFTLKPINPARLNNPDTGEKTIFLDETDGNVKTKGSTGDILFVNESIGVPKVYKALLTQAYGGDPVATVLINTLGGEVVWTRIYQGYYEGTLLNAFPDDKCNISNSSDFYKIINSNGIESDAEIRLSKVSSSTLLLVQNDGVTPLIDNFTSVPVEIEVYP